MRKTVLLLAFTAAAMRGPGTDKVRFDRGVDVVRANCEVKNGH